jgi:hypothetical protein
MRKYEFDLVLERDPTEGELDKVYGAGCDDGTPSYGGSRPPVIMFHREAESLAGAVISTIEQVESIDGLRVIAVEADPLVTIQDIAERTGRTRESVRLLINGQRGAGDFPQPAPESAPRRRMWRWSSVGIYLREDIADVAEAALVSQAVNGWLQMRASVPQLIPPLRAVEAALAAWERGRSAGFQAPAVAE